MYLEGVSLHIFYVEDVDEFIAFAKISRHMPEIRKLVVKFFDFVDVNGDHSIEISELDAARSYLALPPLSDQDHESLVALCNEDEELDFDVSTDVFCRDYLLQMALIASNLTHFVVWIC